MPRLLALALFGMLLVTSLSVIDTDASGFSNVQTSIITVKEKEEPCTSLRLDTGLVVMDQDGNFIKQTAVGTQVLIEGTIIFDCNYSIESPIVVFEVRNEQGVTTYLAWRVFPIESSGQITTGLSWTPDKPGNYEVRLLPIFCLQCPMILTKPATYKITVV